MTDNRSPNRAWIYIGVILLAIGAWKFWPEIAALPELPERRARRALWEASFHWVDKERTVLGIGPGSHVYQIDRLLPHFQRLQPAGIKVEWEHNPLDYLGKLGAVSSIKSVSLANCRELPLLKEFKGLQRLELDDYDSLESMDSFSHLTALERLELRVCDSFADLESLKHFPRLRHLTLGGSALTTLDGLSALPSLEYLSVGGNPDLESFAVRSPTCRVLKLSGRFGTIDLAGLPALQDLDLYRNRTLGDIHGLENLQALQNLKLDGCGSLRRLAGVGSLTSLKRLEMGTRVSGDDRPELGDLSKLTSLEVLYAPGLDKKPRGLRHLTSLRVLNLDRQHSDISPAVFLDAKDLEGLNLLEDLRVWCRDLPDLSVFADMSSMRTLRLQCLDGAPNIRSLTELRGLTNMTQLELRGFESLINVRDLSHMTGLESLTLRAPGLDSLEGIEELKSLRSINLMGCVRLPQGIKETLKLQHPGVHVHGP